MAVVEEHTWAPPLVNPAEVPREEDRPNFSKNAGVPLEAMLYSDFIIEGRWDGVDDALRGVYKEASDNLGREFVYPADE